MGGWVRVTGGAGGGFPRRHGQAEATKAAMPPNKNKNAARATRTDCSGRPTRPEQNERRVIKIYAIHTRKVRFKRKEDMQRAVLYKAQASRGGKLSNSSK